MLVFHLRKIKNLPLWKVFYQSRFELIWYFLGFIDQVPIWGETKFLDVQLRLRFDLGSILSLNYNVKIGSICRIAKLLL